MNPSLLVIRILRCGYEPFRSYLRFTDPLLFGRGTELFLFEPRVPGLFECLSRLLGD